MKAFPSKSLSDNRKSKIQNRKWVGLFVIVIAFMMGGARAEAQQPKKVPRIGILTATNPATNAHLLEAFKQGLRELGYIEGRNIILERRYSEAKTEQFPVLAAELVRLKVDVIVAGTNPVIEAVKRATQTIPIVMPNATDPVGAGFAASLARPGGNITGLSAFSPELNGKRLELLKESATKLTRVSLILNPNIPGNALDLKMSESAARSLGIRIQPLAVLDSADLYGAFTAMTKERADALTMFPGQPVLMANRKRIVDLAAKNRLPAMYAHGEFVDAGGLMFYGTNLAESFRNAAAYVDKILRGANPADLPVEQPKNFEFIINLKAAKQIGLTIPPNVLARADRAIR